MDGLVTALSANGQIVPKAVADLTQRGRCFDSDSLMLFLILYLCLSTSHAALYLHLLLLLFQNLPSARALDKHWLF